MIVAAQIDQIVRVALGWLPNPDKLDKCVNEIIFLQKSARNNF